MKEGTGVAMENYSQVFSKSCDPPSWSLPRKPHRCLLELSHPLPRSNYEAEQGGFRQGSCALEFPLARFISWAAY